MCQHYRNTTWAWAHPCAGCQEIIIGKANKYICASREPYGWFLLLSGWQIAQNDSSSSLCTNSINRNKLQGPDWNYGKGRCCTAWRSWSSLGLGLGQAHWAGVSPILPRLCTRVIWTGVALPCDMRVSSFPFPFLPEDVLSSQWFPGATIGTEQIGWYEGGVSWLTQMHCAGPCSGRYSPRASIGTFSCAHLLLGCIPHTRHRCLLVLGSGFCVES